MKENWLEKRIQMDGGSVNVQGEGGGIEEEEGQKGHIRKFGGESSKQQATLSNFSHIVPACKEQKQATSTQSDKSKHLVLVLTSD